MSLEQNTALAHAIARIYECSPTPAQLERVRQLLVGEQMQFFDDATAAGAVRVGASQLEQTPPRGHSLLRELRPK